MARFYADIQGNRGQATRMGTKSSGIDGHIRGWNSGAKVCCSVDNKGRDVVEVYATHGSGYGGNGVVAGLVMRTVDGKVDFLATKKALNKTVK